MITTSLLELDSVFDAIFARPTHRPVAGPQKLHVEETEGAVRELIHHVGPGRIVT